MWRLFNKHIWLLNKWTKDQSAHNEILYERVLGSMIRQVAWHDIQVYMGMSYIIDRYGCQNTVCLIVGFYILYNDAQIWVLDYLNKLF